jgi:hypothetical protein
MTEEQTPDTEPMLDLDELEKRALLAPSGPWFHQLALGSFEYRLHDLEGARVLSVEDQTPDAASRAGAHAAGADPTTVLHLIAEVRKGREASSHFDTLMGFMVKLAEVAGAQPPSSLVDGVEDLVDETITKMVTGG